jgi:hypothetical protein
MKGLPIGAVLWFYVVSIAAGEHPACYQPFSSPEPKFPILSSSIPVNCEHPELTRLNSNRAQLYELMSDFNSLNRGISANKSAQAYYEAYRIFIGLAESFAVRAMARGDLTALDRLNETYRQYIEITELRLKGYDLIADRLERELR